MPQTVADRIGIRAHEIAGFNLARRCSSLASSLESARRGRQTWGAIAGGFKGSVASGSLLGNRPQLAGAGGQSAESMTASTFLRPSTSIWRTRSRLSRLPGRRAACSSSVRRGAPSMR